MFCADHYRVDVIGLGLHDRVSSMQLDLSLRLYHHRVSIGVVLNQCRVPQARWNSNQLTTTTTTSISTQRESKATSTYRCLVGLNVFDATLERDAACSAATAKCHHLLRAAIVVLDLAQLGRLASISSASRFNRLFW